MTEKKKSVLGTLAGLFVVQDEAQTEEQGKAPETEPEEKDAPEPANAAIDKDLMAKLRAALLEEKLEGFEYLQFKETLRTMDVADDEVKFKAGISAAKAMKASPEILIDSAKQYIRMINDQVKDSNSKMTEKEQELKDQEKEVEAKQAQIEKLTAEKEALIRSTTRERRKITASKNVFDATCQALIDEITSDVSRIKKLK